MHAEIRLSSSALVKFGVWGERWPTTSQSAYSSSSGTAMPGLLVDWLAPRAWFALICSMFWFCRRSMRVANAATASVRLVWSRISVCSVCSSASRLSSTSRSLPISPASSGRLSSAPPFSPTLAGWLASAASISLPTSLMLAPSTSRSTMLQIW
ncbi:hypothetical protein PHYSODRAFT_514185 [Phytophthora sojae]|uniref:Uncharacterized protein n=1 Tax=Phytophthora sojae (strain P6497) TaxID=1094619 RepID=G4ZQW8_PHYSP|nr:hypothetical protein PHYSODRAFT_514185 [Phytophthora sojae]EGZ13916.1 hypothetical protein PHYSODRAFT_514185 [Phytophthora sojae]|eukprot:XP_009531345.1 hypothetical protein PHYSODRAFT_514185 [Phytophthora sojae]